MSTLLKTAVAGTWLALSGPLIANPLNPETPAKPAEYQSAFTGYSADEEIEPADWKAANDRVGAIGGWRTYLREATEPEPTPQDSGGRE